MTHEPKNPFCDVCNRVKAQRAPLSKGTLDLGMVQAWISTLVAEQGDDIFRMKGVLSIAHSNQRFVFHGVHMLVSGIVPF